MSKPNYYWRLFATGLCFTLFGLGGLIIGFTVFPLLHLFSANQLLARKRCQYVVHLSFRFFIWIMKVLGVLTYEVEGEEHLREEGPGIIIANHPSLIDVIFIVARMRHSLCIVKKAAWYNPFMTGIMLSTGYVANEDPEQLIEECAQRVRSGEKLIVFPEGTRTVPGQPMKLKRGAASIIVNAQVPFTPVAMACKPTTLTKAEKWYQIPPKPMHIRMAVAAPIDPRSHIIEGERLSQASRRINRLLAQVLMEGVDRNERAY